MSAPAQADWTTEVSWTKQCEGIDWGKTPDELEKEDLRVSLGEEPKLAVYPAFNGIAFIKDEEERAAERQKNAVIKKSIGSSIPGRWDHAERHKSHRARYVAGQKRRLASLKSLTVHLLSGSNEDAATTAWLGHILEDCR